MKTRNKALYYIKLLIIAAVSAAIQATAYTTFVQVGGFYPSGFSGISRLTVNIVEMFLDFRISYSFLYFGLNILTAIFVYRQIGKMFTVYSIIQTTLFSVFVNYFEPVIVVNEYMLMAIFGGVLNGVGAGLALANNFSTGGFDFLSIYFSNKYNRSIWNYVLMTNACILCIAGIIFNWETTMYSIVYQYATTQMVKLMHKRYTHDTLTIITSKPEEVTKSILSKIRHGITITNAEGAYLHQKESVLYTVVNSFQTQTVIKAAKEADPKVFINVQNSKEVVGNYYQLPLD